MSTIRAGINCLPVWPNSVIHLSCNSENTGLSSTVFLLARHRQLQFPSAPQAALGRGHLAGLRWERFLPLMLFCHIELNFDHTDVHTSV